MSYVAKKRNGGSTTPYEIKVAAGEYLECADGTTG